MTLRGFLVLCVLMGLFADNVQAQDSLTLRKIKETGIITIGFRVGSIPFSYLDNKQRPIGYSMDLCDAIVGAVKTKLNMPNLEVKFKPITSANRMPLISNDIVDMECGSTTNNAERQKKVSFTVTTFVASIRMLSKKTLNAQTIEDLRGKTVVSTSGTTSAIFLAELNRSEKLDMNILLTKDHTDAFHLVETDRASIFIMDDVLLYGLVASNKSPIDYVISDDALSVQPYGIIVRKDDPEFKSVADNALMDLFRSGEINHIYEKWFQKPIPPNQINLRMPMSDALKDAIAHPIVSTDPRGPFLIH